MNHRKMERPFVWLGGGVFVASLASIGWTYLVRFGAARSFVGWRPLLVDAMLVALFALHHSICARSGIKQALSRVVPERLLRSVYVWLASLLLLLVCVAWQPVGGSLYRLTGSYAWAIGAMPLAGVILIARAVRAIDALELAGIRAGRVGSPLQTQGAYGLVRHPLYLGWTLIVFGAPHMTGDRLTFALLTTGYVMLAVPWEEQGLAAQFGIDYETYRGQVRWRMIQFVY
jgi:protein-S-isoprenylcysteine O-methyltransferase Ste14